jgi:hypothetical protein
MFAASAVVRVVLSVYTKIFADQSAGGNVRMNNVLPGWIDNLPATEGFSGLTGTPTGNIYSDPDGTGYTPQILRTKVKPGLGLPKTTCSSSEPSYSDLRTWRSW